MRGSWGLGCVDIVTVMDRGMEFEDQDEEN